MGSPYLSEIRIMSFNYPPTGWALCNGQLLPINQNQALFALLGTTYGGDGRVNFALPDLRGRIPVHVGNGLTLGQSSGEETHSLSTAELPAHTHPVAGSSNIADQNTPVGNFWANGGNTSLYSNATNAALAAQAITFTGGGQAHDNLSPYLTLSFCIALQGIFPSQT